MQGSRGIDEHRIDELVRNIRRIDRLLENSVNTLINFMERAADDPRKMPLFVSAKLEHVEEKMYRVPHAIACSTLLRLNVLRRRFSFLRRGSGDNLSRVVRAIPKHFQPPRSSFDTDEQVMEYMGDHLSSATFGALNPLTASWVFWTLMYAGEAYAHSGLGFLAFFSMFWALERGRPQVGAGVDPWTPTAYITSRCLFPIEMMIGTCQRRADRLETVTRVIDELERLASSKTEHDRWMFALKLDSLSTLLHETALIAIDPAAFGACANELTDLASKLSCHDEVGDSWTAAKKALVRMLTFVGGCNSDVIASASDVVDKFIPQLIDILGHKERRDLLVATQCRQFSKDASEKDWEQKQKAASNAHALCKFALEAYRTAMQACTGMPEDSSTQDIRGAIQAIVDANRRVKRKFEAEIKDSLDWCKTIVNEESARASAGSESDFDATELVNSMAICVRAGKMTNSEVKDAVLKALQGKQSDGSWAPGKPFYIQNRVLGAWSTTSETVWTLASALVSHPEISEADDALLAFVEWLERTQQPVREPEREIVSIGWSSERFRQLDVIDTWATCNAINALLPIRTLFEYRLWEICERNFTVVEEFRDLEKIDPVDLSRPHGQRLHHQLIQTAWRTGGADRAAEYAFILHGPPGTLKTTIAGALAQQLWRTTQFAKRPEPAGTTGPRMVRITPADFMHGGEADIDARARVIFKLLTHLRGATIFFDEIDDFLRRREFKSEPSFIKLVAPAMLNRLQDLRDAAPMQEICFVLGTNFIDKIDPALIRPGRIDQAIAVVYPDLASKKAIAQKVQLGQDLIDAISTEDTLFWPYQTFVSFCQRLTSENAKKIDPGQFAAMANEFRPQAERSERFYMDRERWKLGDDRFCDEFMKIVTSHGSTLAAKFLNEKLRPARARSSFPTTPIDLIEKYLTTAAPAIPTTPEMIPITPSDPDSDSGHEPGLTKEGIDPLPTNL